jgi:hypothetical protein
VAFSDDLAGELPSKRLLPADEDSKVSAVRFLSELRPGSKGLSDPTPALRRAFEVLRKADPNKPGHLILLMTDGVLSPTDGKTLRKDLKQMQAGLEVKLHVRYYGPGQRAPGSFASLFGEAGAEITGAQGDRDRQEP